MASAVPPASSTSRATLWMVPGNLGWGSADLAARTRLAPFLAQLRAMARTMPRLAPVMMMVLSFSVVMGVVLVITLGWRSLLVSLAKSQTRLLERCSGLCYAL